jgi:hypothetical protein
MSTWKGVEWGIWCRSFGYYGLVNKPKFWIDLICTLAWNVSYGGLYDLGYSLHNPFGERRIDVAHEAIGGGIRRLSVALAGAKMIPKSMTSQTSKNA